MTTHVLKWTEERGGVVRFIRAQERGLPCWFYVRFAPEKLAEYERKLVLGALNVRDYGVILHSDWGAQPPRHIIESMREAYGVETPEDED
jgi:transposase InsO family protein